VPLRVVGAVTEALEAWNTSRTWKQHCVHSQSFWWSLWNAVIFSYPNVHCVFLHRFSWRIQAIVNMQSRRRYESSDYGCDLVGKWCNIRWYVFVVSPALNLVAKDLEKNGSQFGVTKEGKFAIITNIRFDFFTLIRIKFVVKLTQSHIAPRVARSLSIICGLQFFIFSDSCLHNELLSYFLFLIVLYLKVFEFLLLEASCHQKSICYY
jgi:hypothetical protein